MVEERINAMVLSLNAIMKNKLSILFEIHNITSQEDIYINENGIEQLGNLIKEKQELMSEIDCLDRKFLVGFDELKKELGVESLEEYSGNGNENLADLRLNTSDIMEVLNKIDKLDKKVHAKMSKLRAELASELIKIKKQRHVSKIYDKENEKGVMRDLGMYDTSRNSSFDKKK